MIEVTLGDIFQQDVEAIVNPANTHMLHGGGLAGMIARRAGPALVKASQAQAPIQTGEAIVTGPGEMKWLKAVIHTVGPVWRGSDADPYWRRNSTDEDPDELLRRAHLATLKLAGDKDIHSIAFPAVSCGVFRFPAERAAPIAIGAVREALRLYSPPVERVVFCLLDDSHHQAFAKALAVPEIFL